ncbi:zinc/cadmium/mercury/lead-transporting ATPase [Photobacterium lucens]|uniref:zinc/cadmium/mercury/lead-transporting ATPase n=1 Tax=Photobacterium lucens TaxID=2562949 RepID=UPI00136D48DB|nr:zinc/cadmium/mercury/lead-transporting ATPase [Photobacterium lucens]MZG57810.1 zinc/cadmium/mercury/lead-transporting ATPase [Photobacterium lucens]MZG79840.1 zinc/cadmium/mercury/lead-transporting ATPase [Photobacterium lucens]
MCAQCHNKKPHIHAAKPTAVTKATVTVESCESASCCSSTAADGVKKHTEGCGESDTDGPASCCSSKTSPQVDALHSAPVKTAFKIASATSSATTHSHHEHSSEHAEHDHAHGEHDHAGHSHSGTSCCSAPSMTKAQEQALEASLTQSAHGQTFSWKVVGMDCPSCAAKLEKSISSLAEVETAKVMFATEKLIVNMQPSQQATTEQLKKRIEDKAQDTGFTLVANAAAAEALPKKSFIQTHLEVIVIAAMMFLSFLLNQVSHSVGLVAFTLTTIVGLVPIVKKAISLGKSGSPFSIETLMSIAAIGALYLGETAEAAMVILLFLIGEQLEGYAASRARSGVKALMDLVPEEANVVLPNGEKKKVPASELKPGDVIEVVPGERLPADGQVLDVVASFDESALTGESVPVERLPGEKVMAGSMASDKVVRLTIISAQGENAIDRILHMIEDAESRKAPLERFIDKFSRWYTPAMILLAALVIIIPPLVFGQSWDEWIYKGLALLLIACPCALVISTPAAITSGLAAAARRGALIKGGAALEQLGHIETVAFDKTGTLTEGKPVVTDLISWDNDDDKLLRQAAAVESGSLHPLATAVVNLALEKSLPVVEADNREALAGRGIQGTTEGDHFMLCAADRLPETISLTAEQEQQAIALEGEGKTLVVAVRNQQAVGLVAWRDNLRSDALEAITKLKHIGVNSVMLTGDNPRAAAAIAKEINIDFRAGLLPEDKVSEVRKLNTNHTVAMVGDGINDAPAMKTATIGVAMGGGTDVALETADAAITHNRVSELPVMIELSRATLSNIRQNITLALGLKVVFLVTTLLGFTGLWVAVLADSGATALVTLNALRLLRFKPKK